MATEERKDNKKPFKGVSNIDICYNRDLSLNLLQAKVEWPADMPDDMLEDSIAIAKKTLDEHDFETDGVEVSRCFYNTFKILMSKQRLKSYLSCYRLPERSRSTWTRNGSPTGTYSWASHLVVTQCTSATASFTSHLSPAKSPSSSTRPPEQLVRGQAGSCGLDIIMAV